jgi:hypothetical protein
MESARAQYVIDRVDADGYEPDVIDGAEVGEFHQIEPVDSADKLDVCLWRADRRHTTIYSRVTRRSMSSRVRPRSSFPTAARGSTSGRGTLGTSAPAHDQSGRSRSRSKSSR